MACRREGFTVRVQRSGSAAPAGVGFVVDDTHIVTCAHVVNTALGRDQRVQEKPSPLVRIQVDFPMLGGAAGAPSRSCTVQAWVPPPTSGITGGDVAGLVIVGEGLPGRAGPARLVDRGTRDVVAGAFGYPGDPPRQVNGAWSELTLRGAVGGGVIQLDTASGSSIRAQPGYSGSPVIAASDTGDDMVLGMLAVASGDDGAGDAYAIPVSELASAWPEVVGRLTIPACPYRGLGAFTADDADVFVGREGDVGRLREMVCQRPLVVVTGPSGVGKSSLVNAGLIPLLRGQGWAAGSFRPGGMPLEALARALAAVQAPGRPPTVPEVGEWAALIRSDGLASLGTRLALNLRQPILLHVDQLEEILDPAVCPESLTAEFLEVLLSAQAAPDEGLHLVATLRADFWTQLLEQPDAGTRLVDRWFGLSPMSKDRLEKVIAEPAQARDVQYQDGLVRVIAEDGDEGYGLPLLEFALTQLWPHQQGRQISLAAYQSIGGVAGALSRHAELAYQDLLDKFPEERIRRVMLALVRSRGGAAEATRRVVSRDRIGADWEVAQALARQRLLTVGRDEGKGEETAEITHEALIRKWPRFAGWVNDDADFQHWLASAEERAADGELLPDTRLAEADRWVAERGEDLPHEVKQLVQDSKSEWLKRVSELEEARQSADEAARHAAMAAQQSEARRLAAAAELALASPRVPLQVPIVLAVESMRLIPTIEGNIAIRNAIRIAPAQRSRTDHDGPVHAVAFSPDGSQVVTGSADGTARVLDARSGAQLCRLDHDGPVIAVAFSPDGSQVVTGSADGTARVMGAHSGAQAWRVDHDRPVIAVAFSPDGSQVVTGSGIFHGGAARVLDARSGAQAWRVDHDGPVIAVAFSPDGSQVVTGSADGTARVLEAVTGAQAWRADHDRPVNAVAFSPDGSQVVTGSADGTARGLDVDTGAQAWRVDHDAPVNAVAFSPGGSQVATGSGTFHGGAARVLDARSGAQLCRLDHDGPVNAVAFSPDGSQVVTGSADGTTRVLEAVTGAQLCKLDHDGPVNAVAFSPDGSQVVTGSADGTARVLDARSGAQAWRVDDGGPVNAVAFSPDGSQVVTGSADGTTRVLEAVTGAQLCKLDHDGPVHAVAFSPDGSQVVTGSADGTARVLDARSGAQLCRLDHDGPVIAVAFSPDGSQVVTGSADGTARVMGAHSGAQAWRVDHDRPVIAVAFSPDGSQVVTGSGIFHGGAARVLDARSGAQAWRVDHDGPVIAVAFSPDGSQVVTGSADGTARVLEAVTGAQAWRADHDRPVNAVAFSPDGSQVVTGSADGTARGLDVDTGAQAWRVDHDAPVNAVAFSPGGSQVATGSGTFHGGAARVLDARSGAQLCRLDHDGPVNAVAFSPDGSQVVTGSADGTTRVWVVDHVRLIKQAESRLTRRLTESERRRYFHDEPHS